MILVEKAVFIEVDYSTKARLRMNLTYPSSRYRSSHVHCNINPFASWLFMINILIFHIRQLR